MARAPVLLVALPLLAVAACSGALDQAHSVQTRLNRIDEVVASRVSTPSPSTGAAIEVVYDDADTVRSLSRLVKAVDAVADDEDYPSYRLDLVPAANEHDRLTVDDSFGGSTDQASVLDNWLATTGALLGDVRYTFEPGTEEIDVDSGAGIAHDVGEASRIRYGFPGTVWTFRDGASSFVASGRVSPTDVLLFQGAQRTVTSEILPAPASAWTLERRDRQVLLDLHVAFPGGPMPPERLTVRRYGDAVARLSDAAMSVVRVAGLPATIRLIAATPDGDDDVFGYWVSDRRPVRGRDPLARGWDLWLAHRGDGFGDRLRQPAGSAT
ncbi:hypothetical protein GCM10009606_42000 [Nocardioides aquiterrae]|uniref:GerMN domain-containing protein n=1 Tax=Nocardioides aquiterrae TaxID=203799 RepID=A0ABP4F7B1_9ACTN